MTQAFILSVESHSGRFHKTRLLIYNLKGACKQVEDTHCNVKTGFALFDSLLRNYCILVGKWDTMLAHTQFVKMFADAGQQSGDLTPNSFLLELCYFGMLTGLNNLQLLF
jgi:hypothetical protein